MLGNGTATQDKMRIIELLDAYEELRDQSLRCFDQLLSSRPYRKAAKEIGYNKSTVWRAYNDPDTVRTELLVGFARAILGDAVGEIESAHNAFRQKCLTIAEKHADDLPRRAAASNLGVSENTIWRVKHRPQTVTTDTLAEMIGRLSDA